MKIDYVISININLDSGKSKATKEKIEYFLKANKDTNIYFIGEHRLTSIKILSMIYLEIMYLFKAILSKNKPDIIFTRSFFMFGTYIVSKLYNTVLIREIHGDNYDESRILHKNSKYKQCLFKLYTKYSNWFNNRSDGLIFNNKLLEEYFKNNYLTKKINTVSIHNGTDVCSFIPKDGIISKKRLGLDYEKQYLLFLGSISKWHGVEYILEMFNCLKSYSINYHLLIVGGIDADYLLKLKDKYYDIENITFTGKVDKNLAVEYINASNICLLPVNNIRISPGSPLKLFDYAACGKAIITQENVIGYSDIINNYNLGMTCNFTNPNESAIVINKFIKSMDLNYYLNNNRKCAVEYFSWEVIINQWIKFAKKCSIH